MNLAQDVRFAIRGLKQAPVFTAVAIVSVALGIGANTAIFTLLDQVLLRLLPVKDPKQLMLLTSRGSHYGNNRGGNALSYPMYRDFRDHSEVFSGMFCRYAKALNVTFNGRTERDGARRSFEQRDLAGDERSRNADRGGRRNRIARGLGIEPAGPDAALRDYTE